MKKPLKTGAGSKPALKMALFFSHGISLADWDRAGLFDREVGYYRSLSQELGEVLFYTYDLPGNRLDKLMGRLGPVKAIYNRWRLPYRLFGILGPLLHYRELRKCQVFKTNQLSGAWTAAIAKWLLRKPLVVRCGFVGSRNMKRRGESPGRLLLTILLERLALKAANVVFVSTQSDRQYLARTHCLPLRKIIILPNPIDTDLFRINPDRSPEEGAVAFVGRISAEKNIPLLMEACRQVERARLWVIGAGPGEQEARLLAAENKVKFFGALPNSELPTLLNQAQVFVLPSKWEGSPKALLEAMACGLAVIGTDAPGIREVIDHGVNGLLCEPNPDSLTAALERLLKDAPLRARLGSQARDYVMRHNSIVSVLQREVGLLRGLIDKTN